MMKRMTAITTLVVWMTSIVGAQFGAGGTQVDATNQTQSNLNQQTSLIGGGNAGSDSNAESASIAQGGLGYSYSNLSLSTTSNVRNRTHPLPAQLPYLPMWQHGGWGTVKGYFANGPVTNGSVYERSFDSRDPEDVREIRNVLLAIPHTGPLKRVGGLWNGICVALGGPDRFHHGRGFEIANSVDRIRRRASQPMMVFIDSSVDTKILEKAGYSYAGKISIEGRDTRNWDQVYNAALAEALPWSIDLLLVSGGMKGVTVGSNTSVPSGTVGYSQLHYSMSLLGGQSKGVTEGKGKPVLSAAAYRFSPRMSFKRGMPRLFYQRLHLKYGPKLKEQKGQEGQEAVEPVSYGNPTGGKQGIQMSNELLEMAGYNESQKIDYVSVPQRQGAR